MDGVLHHSQFAATEKDGTMKKYLLILAIGLTGCTSTYVDYKTPNGGNLSLHRRSMLTKVDMPSVKFNPDGSVEMVGYKNDQAGAVSDAVKAACKGAVEGAIGK